MEHPTSRLVLAAMLLGAASSPAIAQNYDDLSRSDFISLSAGNASASNLAIQTPTPWPPYVNDTRILGNGVRGVMAIDQMYLRYAQPPGSPPPGLPPANALNPGGN